MIDEREIWACANLLLRQHGNAARDICARRADALLAEGQVEGHRTFQRIGERIEQLERVHPAGAVH